MKSVPIMVQGRFDLVASVCNEEEGCYGKEKYVVFLFPSQAQRFSPRNASQNFTIDVGSVKAISHNATYSFIASLIGHGGAGGVVGSAYDIRVHTKLLRVK